jgi:hypothetical protein
MNKLHLQTEHNKLHLQTEHNKLHLQLEQTSYIYRQNRTR